MDVTAQLYIFTKLPDLEEQLSDLLQALSEAGYSALEGMFGYPPETPDPVAVAGLRYQALHLGTRLLDPLAERIEFCQRLGATEVCCSGPLQWDQRDAASFRATAQHLNAAGRELRAAGIHLHYHNHEFEFDEVAPGQTAMDLLLSECDSQAVTLCLDVGWQWLTGTDPLAFLQAHGDRVGFVHLRDFRGRDSCPLGQGDLPLKELVPAICSLPNLRALVVEQDPTTPTPLADMLTSRDYLRREFDV